MTMWQRSPRQEDTELDIRIAASRARYIAEHDATFDHEAGWADVVARVGLASSGHDRPDVVSDTVSNLEPGDDVPEVVVGRRWGPRHVSGRKMILAGAGCIAAASVLVAGIVVLGSNGSNGSNGDGPEPDLATEIIAATEDALATAVEHEVTDLLGSPPRPDFEAWRDQATINIRHLNHAPDGRGPSLDVGPNTPPTPDDSSPSGSILQRRVDHCFEEYTIEELRLPPGSADHNASLAQQIIDGLSDGTMRTDGTEVVDGEELIRVVEDGDMMNSAWYVDPETHRPVRLVVPPGEYTGEGSVTTVEYLPRTPELLAQFTPTIPDGFVEVDELTRVDQTMQGCM